MFSTRERQKKEAEEAEAERRKKEERQARRAAAQASPTGPTGPTGVQSSPKEEPGPTASLGLAKSFAAAFGAKTADGPAGGDWGLVKGTLAKKQDAAAKAKWHFFDKVALILTPTLTLTLTSPSPSP